LAPLSQIRDNKSTPGRTSCVHGCYTAVAPKRFRRVIDGQASGTARPHAAACSETPSECMQPQGDMRTRQTGYGRWRR